MDIVEEFNADFYSLFSAAEDLAHDDFPLEWSEYNHSKLDCVISERQSVPPWSSGIRELMGRGSIAYRSR